MTPEEQDQMFYLAKCIQKEEDHTKLMQLITELNELLARTETRPTLFRSSDHGSQSTQR